MRLSNPNDYFVIYPFTATNALTFGLFGRLKRARPVNPTY